MHTIIYFKVLIKIKTILRSELWSNGFSHLVLQSSSFDVWVWVKRTAVHMMATITANAATGSSCMTLAVHF